MTLRIRRAGLVAATVFIAACSSSGTGESSDKTDSLTLVTHDSFYVSEGIFDAFTKETGITVTVAQGADAGTLVNQAILTAGKPEGDVLWGVDNTLLSRAVTNKLFEPYQPKGDTAKDIDASALALVPNFDATPVDRGDVCVNVDRGWFETKGIKPPAGLADLTDPTYKGLAVVQNPTTSSPGLAFLMATVAAYGDGWTDYWKKLRANDVKVVDGWTTAYQSEFTRAQGGTRPIVVSYGTSPVAEVAPDADPATATAATDVLTDSCFRQVEFAGILRGTKKVAAAKKLIDFLLSDQFQGDMPLNMFVFPIRSSVTVPPIFANTAVLPEKPLSLAPAEIDANRETWLKTWSSIML